jgi:hypothetical protein
MKTHTLLFGLWAVLLALSVLSFAIAASYWQLFARSENDRDLVEMIGFGVSVLSLVLSVGVLAAGIAAWMNRRR